MTTTEEIVVSGEDFIERRIFIHPRPLDLANVERRSYDRGYNRGWLGGFLLGLVVVGFAAICVWLAVQG